MPGLHTKKKWFLWLSILMLSTLMWKCSYLLLNTFYLWAILFFWILYNIIKKTVCDHEWHWLLNNRYILAKSSIFFLVYYLFLLEKCTALDHVFVLSLQINIAGNYFYCLVKLFMIQLSEDEVNRDFTHHDMFPSLDSLPHIHI